MERLKYFVNNEFKESGAEIWYDLHNPSTGEVTGQAPCCTNDEVLEAIEAAKAAFPAWKNTPARKRAAVSASPTAAGTAIPFFSRRY
ncbi:MAG: aldehyde dehydrogenase family protein, partial [Eubacterium coprostanoligenes]|nr:aldehyde dehydrogenase family protein [Eubacterium coprostanoligenes]